MQAKSITFKAPEGMTGISHAGESYEVVDGKVTLPGNCDVAQLVTVGLEPLGAEAEDEPAPQEPETGGAGDDQGAANTSTPAPAAEGAIAPPWAAK